MAVEDLRKESWVESANDSDSPFPLNNLPYGLCRGRGEEKPFLCSAIGDSILNLALLEEERLLPTRSLFDKPSLNAFMQSGEESWKRVRSALKALLDKNNSLLRDNRPLAARALLPKESVEMLLPVEIGDYTDFYSSKEHATNVGTMFRGRDNALNPNWLHLPVAYHGRASSIVASGTPIRRPLGQAKGDQEEAPSFGPSKWLDFELEIGFFIGTGNALGHPIPIDRAESHIFGLSLVNDWSARDIQKWEYLPLGPFLGKNFATTLSPWIVPLEALAPFRCPPREQLPKPLPYLSSANSSAYDITLEIYLKTPLMEREELISLTNSKSLYWSMVQQVAHHTVNGCNMRPGDLLASGTISGEGVKMRGSLLELTWGGEEPLRLSTGETRTFLQDGDEVIMRGKCRGDGYVIGFGDLTGKIVGATSL